MPHAAGTMCLTEPRKVSGPDGKADRRTNQISKHLADNYFPGLRLPKTRLRRALSFGPAETPGSYFLPFVVYYELIRFGAMDVTKPYDLNMVWGHGCHQTL